MPRRKKYKPRLKNYPKVNYYQWQKDVLATTGNLILRSGRQVGKSEVISEKCARYALENKNKTVMVIAFVEKQAYLIFAKILNKIFRKDPDAILGGVDRPTKHKIALSNGTEIYCFAAGETGYGIMGYTIDLLIADEAAFVSEEVWNSVIPTLAATQGTTWLLSTPKLKEGFYYDCFEDPTYSNFHESSEDCPHITKEFLEDKKRRFTQAQYAQMYLGEFVDDFQMLFSKEWMEKVCIVEQEVRPEKGEGALGVDIAAMGEDESAFSGLAWQGNILTQFHFETTSKTETPETEDKIKDLDARYDLGKIGIDDGGIGASVLSHLLRNDATKRKVVGLNNAKRVIDADDNKKTLYKEAMYMNLLAMGEHGQLALFKNDKIIASLRSVLVEENGKIIARYNHPVESIIRGAYLLKEKSLNPTVYSIKI